MGCPSPSNSLALLTMSADPDFPAELRLAIGRLARRLRQDGAIGLTPSQLSALVGIEAEDEGRKLGELADLEGVSAPTMTKIVASLERDGLVERSEDASDRRCIRVRVTVDGREALSRARARGTVALSGLLDSLTARERETLRAVTPLLKRLADTGR